MREERSDDPQPGEGAKPNAVMFPSKPQLPHRGRTAEERRLSAA
jgi:hypothetical protein